MSRSGPRPLALVNPEHVAQWLRRACRDRRALQVAVLEDDDAFECVRAAADLYGRYAAAERVRRALDPPPASTRDVVRLALEASERWLLEAGGEDSAELDLVRAARFGLDEVQG